MKFTEKLLVVVIVCLMVLRLITSYPFASLLISLLCLILSIIYFFLGFALLNSIRFRNIFKKSEYKNISILRVLGTIFTGFFLSLTAIYILFKFQSWPYGNIGLQICLICLTIILVVVSTKYIISKDKFYFLNLIRLMVFILWGGLLYFTTSEQLLEMKFRNFPDYVEAEKALMKDPLNKYLEQKANEERRKMDLSN